MSLALGIPVGEMLRRMTSRELSEYMAYDQFEPIGEARADLRAGILASAVVNHSISPPRSPTKPVDFMPFARSFKDAAAALDPVDPQKNAQVIGKALFGDRVMNYAKKDN